MDIHFIRASVIVILALNRAMSTPVSSLTEQELQVAVGLGELLLKVLDGGRPRRAACQGRRTRLDPDRRAADPARAAGRRPPQLVVPHHGVLGARFIRL